jgi:hypothetical protein
VALAVEVDEHLLDAAGVGRVHGEAFAGPVAGGADLLQLLDDDAAVLLLPLPHFGEEGVAAEVVAVLDGALLLQSALDDRLGGDAGVVGAGEPEDLLALHAGLAGEDVLDGVVEDMAEGEDAGDVGGGDDDGVRRAAFRDPAGVGGETAVFLPVRVPLVLDGLGLVSLGDLAHVASGSLPETGGAGQQTCETPDPGLRVPGKAGLDHGDSEIRRFGDSEGGRAGNRNRRSGLEGGAEAGFPFLLFAGLPGLRVSAAGFSGTGGNRRR